MADVETVDETVPGETRDAVIEVVREPLTYEPGAPRSYFRDLVLSQVNEHDGAEARLQRHAQEMEVEIPKREARIQRELEQRASERGFETRTNPNRTDGQGGYFSPPLWLIDQFATAVRPKRVLADLAPNFTLPRGISQVNVPRLTTGTKTRNTPDLAVPGKQDAVDAVVTSEVVTIAGQGETSLQVLEQSAPGAHLDWVLFRDLSEDYDQQLEVQLLNGSGTAPELTGLLQVTIPAANAVAYTDASPTGSEICVPLGKAIAAVGNSRKLPPECWLMTTSRYGWLATSEDTAGQPLGLFSNGSLSNRDGAGEVDLLAFPIKLDDAMPINLGTGANEDRIVSCRPSDMLVLESEPRASVMKEVLSGELGVRLQLHSYAASLPGRYPSSIAVLSGTGMIVQSGY